MRHLPLTKWLLGVAALLCVGALGTARAQTAPQSLVGVPINVDLPVSVTVSGNVAVAQIGGSSLPLGEVTLTFDDASNLTPASLGLSAKLVDLQDPQLLARLPDANLNKLSSSLPLLITIQPPVAGGLTFHRTGQFELHTHQLLYSVGSDYRVFKAPVGGAFRDTTEEIAQGSVRARSRYGGFSQFLVLVDLRGTGTVIAEKIAWLRNRVSTLPASEQPVFSSQLDTIESAVASHDYANALTTVDALSARAQADAGTALLDTWRAGGADNQAGDLIAGAATLKFSIAYLRDFGQ